METKEERKGITRKSTKRRKETEKIEEGGGKGKMRGIRENEK